MATEQLGNIIYQVDMEVSRLIRAQQEVNSRLTRMENQFERTGNHINKFSGVLNKVGVAIAAHFSIQTAKRIMDIADSMSILQARIRRLSESAQTASTTYNELITIATKTGNSVSGTVQLWESLTASLKEIGATNHQVLRLTETLQKIGSIGGTSAESMSNALRQFGQSIAGGIVRAEEFNSVLENMPELARQIALGMGVTLGELRQLMLDGKLTAVDALNAIQARSSAVSAEFDQMPISLERAANAFESELGRAISTLNDAVGLTRFLAKQINDLATGLRIMSGELTYQEKINQLLKERNELKEREAGLNSKWSINSKQQLEWIKKRIAEIDAEYHRLQDEEIKRIQESNQKLEDKKQKLNEISDKNKKILQDLKNQQTLGGLSEREAFATRYLQQMENLNKADAQAIEDAKKLAYAIYDQNKAKEEQKEISRKAAQEAKKLQQEREQAVKKATAEAKRAAEKEIQSLEQAQVQVQQLANQYKMAMMQKRGMSREATLLETRLNILSGATEAHKKQVEAQTGAFYQAIVAAEKYAGAMYDLSAMDDLNALMMDFSPTLRLDMDKAVQDRKIAEGIQAYRNQIAMIDQAMAEMQSKPLSVDTEQQLEELTTAKGVYLSVITSAEEMRTQLEAQYRQQRMEAQWEEWKQASEGAKMFGSAVEAVGANATSVITGLLNGTMSVREAFASVANTILNSVVQSLVEMGMAQVKQMIIGQTVAKTSLAANKAQAASLSTMWATPAALASLATNGSNAAAANTALTGTIASANALAGVTGRKLGGPVSARQMYRVGENNQPEIFKASNGMQYMIPGQSGRVFSNKDAQSQRSGGSKSVTVVVHQTNHFSGDENARHDQIGIAKALSEQIKTAVKMELQTQMRAGGVLAR